MTSYDCVVCRAARSRERGTLVYRRPIGWLSLKPFSVEVNYSRAVPCQALGLPVIDVRQTITQEQPER